MIEQTCGKSETADDPLVAARGFVSGVVLGGAIIWSTVYVLLP